MDPIAAWLLEHVPADERPQVIMQARHLYHALPYAIAGPDPGPFPSLDHPRARLAWALTQAEWQFFDGILEVARKYEM